MILFTSLTDDDLIKIIDLLVNQVNVNLVAKQVKIRLTPKAAKYLLEKTCADTKVEDMVRSEVKKAFNPEFLAAGREAITHFRDARSAGRFQGIGPRYDAAEFLRVAGGILKQLS